MKKVVSLGVALIASLLFAGLALAAEPVVEVSPATVDLGQVAAGETVSSAVTLTLTPKDLAEEVVIEVAPGEATAGWKVEVAAQPVTLKPGDAPQTVKFDVKVTATPDAKEDLKAQLNLVVKKGKATLNPAGLTATAQLKK